VCWYVAVVLCIYLLKMIEEREKEMNKVMDILAAMKKFVSKIDEKDDVVKFVNRHRKAEIAIPEIATFEPAETNVRYSTLSSFWIYWLH
jgi:hypothetical protein